MDSNQVDLRMAEQMINAGLLTEINAEKIRTIAPGGAILITCGDRDRVTGHFTGCQDIVPIHLIALNGGALLLSDGIDADAQQVVLENCVEAIQLKNINFIFCLSHFPCGKGELLGMGLRENILANLRAKDFLKRRFGSTVGVLSMVGIDWREAGLPDKDGICLYSTGRDKQDAIIAFQQPDHQPHSHFHHGGCANQAA